MWNWLDSCWATNHLVNHSLSVYVEHMADALARLEGWPWSGKGFGKEQQVNCVPITKPFGLTGISCSLERSPSGPEREEGKGKWEGLKMEEFKKKKHVSWWISPSGNGPLCELWSTAIQNTFLMCTEQFLWDWEWSIFWQFKRHEVCVIPELMLSNRTGSFPAETDIWVSCQILVPVREVRIS